MTDHDEIRAEIRACLALPVPAPRPGVRSTLPAECRPPRTTLFEALRDPEARARRDREFAEWCGLTEAQTAAFLERLRIFDARTPVFEEERAQEEYRALVARRAPGDHRGIRAPRIRAPRLSA